jgi:hypothetical protein
MMNQRLRRSRLFKFAFGLLAGAVLLVACTPMPRTQSQAEAVPSTAAAVAAPAAPAPRLGTQWGEGRESNTRSVQVQRYTPEQPDEVASLG